MVWASSYFADCCAWCWPTELFENPATRCTVPCSLGKLEAGAKEAIVFGPIPEGRVDRWRLLEDFVARWYPPPLFPTGVDPRHLEDAESRLGIRLPPSLRELYQRWGRYRLHWAILYELLAPSQFVVEEGKLGFCREMSTGQYWGIHLDDLSIEDPPLVTWSDRAGVEDGCKRLSSFALHFAAFNVYGTESPFPRANGQATDDACRAIERALPQAPLEALSLPVLRTRFYGSEDLIIRNECDTWLWIVARTPGALGEVEQLLVNTGMTLEPEDLDRWVRSRG